MKNSLLLRGALGVSIGLPLSLIVGMGVSYLPASPLEGLSAGVIVSSVLFVAVLVLLSWTRGVRPLKAWLFDLHSFLGLVTGIFVIAIVFSGTLLIFRGDIESWSHDWLNVQPGARVASVDAWLDAVATKIDLHRTNRIDIRWPRSPTAPVEVRVSGPEGSRTFHVDPYRAILLEGELSTWMDWVRTLHTSLLMGRVGGWLAGLTGLGAVWLVVSGLTMRRGLFRDWRILRFDKGIRVFVSDLHMRIATWLFLFVAVMFYSGMLLAFGEVLHAGPLRARFNGSQSAMLTAMGYPQRVSRTERVAMPKLARFTQVVRHEMPGALISSVRVIAFGDRNAIVVVYASRPGDLVPRGTSLIMSFRAATQRVISIRRTDDMGVFQRLRAAMDALHFADFDAPVIRILYAGASFALILLPILGIVMWVLRRRDSRTVRHGTPPEATS